MISTGMPRDPKCVAAICEYFVATRNMPTARHYFGIRGRHDHPATRNAEIERQQEIRFRLE